MRCIRGPVQRVLGNVATRISVRHILGCIINTLTSCFREKIRTQRAENGLIRIAHAWFTPNREELRTDLRVEKFWISWTREQSLNFCRQIASYRLHRFQGATDTRVNKREYNWRSNKSDLRLHRDWLASSRPLHAIRKSIGINSGPKTTTTAWPPWYACDRPPTDLWCFATD